MTKQRRWAGKSNHHRLPGPQSWQSLSSDSSLLPEAHSEDEKTEAGNPGFLFFVFAQRVWESGSGMNPLPLTEPA